MRSRDALHNSGEAVVGGSGWAARRLFAVNSTAIGKKNNAADRPSPANHSPQGVVQSIPGDAPSEPSAYRAMPPISHCAIWADSSALKAWAGMGIEPHTP